MEIRISKEDFMKIIKRVAKSMLGSVSALNASTIISNNELIYQGTKALIRGNRVHRGVYLDEFYSLLDHETDLRDSIGKMILVDVNSAEISHFDSVFGDLTVRRHIVGGANRTLFSVDLPPRLCRTGT